MRTQSSDSVQQARAMLGAWQKGDLANLFEEQVQFADLPVDSANTEEAERLELLSAIASDLQASVRPFAEGGSEVCGRLLRHLAFPDRQHRLAILPYAVAAEPAAMAAGLR